MRIGLDVQTLQTEEATRGIGRVVRSLVELIVGQIEHEIVFFGRDKDPGEIRQFFSKRISYAQIQCPDGSVAGDAVARAPVADFLRSTPAAAGLDLYHVTSPMMPDILIPAPVDHIAIVATLYDAIPALWKLRRMPLMDREAMLNLDERARVLRSYHQFLPISASTARDCVILQDLKSSRMTITYTPCAIPPKVGDDEARSLAASVKAPGNHILCISGYNPRKNLRGTLAAFAALPQELRQKHPLILVCKLQSAERAELDAQARRLGITEEFIATGYVSDEVLAALLQTARVLFFPSEYEGFGLPVAEALLAGVPVVTCNNSSLPEAAGPGALLTGPSTADSTEALLRILTEDGLSASLASAGQAHARQFLPDAYMERVLRGYVRGLEVMRYGEDRLQGSSFRMQGIAQAVETPPRIVPDNDVEATLERGALRAGLGVPRFSMVIVAGGGVRAANRPEVLAAMLESLAQRHAGLVLAVLGPCERQEVQRMVAWASARCLRHALVVTGPLAGDELDHWLDAADVILTPAKGAAEPGRPLLRRALTRAVAPVIVRNAPGEVDLPAEDICWTVEEGPDEAALLVDLIEALLHQPTVADAMVAAGADWASAMQTKSGV